MVAGATGPTRIGACAPPDPGDRDVAGCSRPPGLQVRAVRDAAGEFREAPDVREVRGEADRDPHRPAAAAIEAAAVLVHARVLARLVEAHQQLVAREPERQLALARIAEE